MDKETLKASGWLVSGVMQEVFEYLTETYDDFKKQDLLKSCDSAIQEVNSWKKAIISFTGKQHSEEKQ